MRIVHVSDTHLREPELPDGDILVHSGDLTKRGYRIECYRQLNWLHLQIPKFKYVVVVPGNHDIYFEDHFEDAWQDCAEAGIFLLHNTSMVLEGYKFYGSAHTPDYHKWAFMLEKSAIHDAWQKIPEDTDVLITHGPAAGILDASYRGPNIGCPELLLRVKEVKPKAHLFGHAHEDGGEIVTIDGTIYSNAATKVNVIDL